MKIINNLVFGNFKSIKFDEVFKFSFFSLLISSINFVLATLSVLAKVNEAITVMNYSLMIG